MACGYSDESKSRTKSYFFRDAVMGEYKKECSIKNKHIHQENKIYYLLNHKPLKTFLIVGNVHSMQEGRGIGIHLPRIRTPA